MVDRDLQPKHRKRLDVAEQFEAAGFKMADWNKYELQSYGQTFTVSPSWSGLKVENETMHEPQVFAFGTKPEIIANWIIGYAQTRYQALTEDWLTANLPPTEDHPLADYAPYCYGLAGEA